MMIPLQNSCTETDTEGEDEGEKVEGGGEEEDGDA